MSASLQIDPAVKRESQPARDFELTEAEADLLLDICLRHRRKLPIYLQSTREVLELIDGVIEKLS